MVKSEDKESGNWFPRDLTITLLSVIVAILTGIGINLLTSPQLTFNFIISIILISISSYSSIIILRIRNRLNESFIKKRHDNENQKITNLKYKLTHDEVWIKTLKKHSNDKAIFKRWKIIGLSTFFLALILITFGNFNSIMESNNLESHILINQSALSDSIDQIKELLNETNNSIIKLEISLNEMECEFQQAPH